MIQDDSSKKGQQTQAHKDAREDSFRLSHSEAQGQHEGFRVSDSFFHQIVNSLEDYAIFTTDKEGTISSWNPGAESIFGYSGEDIIGQNAAIFFIPEDRKKKAPEKVLNTALRDGQAKDEKWHLRKDGSRFWASGFVFPLMSL